MEQVSCCLCGSDRYQVEILGKEGYGLDIAVGQRADQNFPADSFDVVTLWHSLEHLHEPIETLRSIHRALKPDGLLVV